MIRNQDLWPGDTCLTKKTSLFSEKFMTRKIHPASKKNIPNRPRSSKQELLPLTIPSAKTTSTSTPLCTPKKFPEASALPPPLKAGIRNKKNNSGQSWNHFFITMISLQSLHKASFPLGGWGGLSLNWHDEAPSGPQKNCSLLLKLPWLKKNANLSPCSCANFWFLLGTFIKCACVCFLFLCVLHSCLCTANNATWCLGHWVVSSTPLPIFQESVPSSTILRVPPFSPKIGSISYYKSLDSLHISAFLKAGPDLPFRVLGCQKQRLPLPPRVKRLLRFFHPWFFLANIIQWLKPTMY